MNTIRETNNGIFDDIFWVHVAYASADDGSYGCVDCWRRSRLTPRSSPASRRSTEDAVSWRTDRRPRRRLDRRVSAPSGRATSSSSSTERRALVQPHLDRLSCTLARIISMGSALSFEVPRPSAGALLLLLLLRLRVRAGDPANPAGPRLAEDHPLRRPLEVDRDLHRPALPEARGRRNRGRRQPAPHPRRSSHPVRVEALRPAASSRAVTGPGTPQPEPARWDPRVAWQMAFHGKQVTVYDAFPGGLEAGKEFTSSMPSTSSRGGAPPGRRSNSPSPASRTPKILPTAVGEADLLSESVPEDLAIRERSACGVRAAAHTSSTNNASTLRAERARRLVRPAGAVPRPRLRHRRVGRQHRRGHGPPRHRT